MNQKTTLAIAVALVGGVAISVANPWNPRTTSMDPMPILSSQKNKKTPKKPHVNFNMETQHSNLSMDATGIKHVKVDVQLGEVNITTNSSSSFKAEITKGVNLPVDAQERKWLDNPWLKVRREGDTLVVYEDKSLKPDLDRHNDGGKETRKMDFTVNIQIPRGLDADVSLAVGQSTISGEYQSLSGSVATGELTLENVDAREALKIEMEAGEVNANLNQTPRRESSIRVSVGEINLGVKGNATVDAKADIGSVTVSGESHKEQKGLGSNQQIRIGSGGTKFTLKVGAGNINLGSGKVERSLEKDSDDEMDIKLSDHLDRDVTIDKDIQREISDAMREARREVESVHAQKEIDEAMQEAKAELNSVDIQKEVSEALRQAQIEMKSIDIDKEIAKAMRESSVDVESALSDASREIDKAMREIEIEMKSSEDSEGRYRFLSRDALKIAKQALDKTRASLKRSFSHGKVVPHKPAKKQTNND